MSGSGFTEIEFFWYKICFLELFDYKNIKLQNNFIEFWKINEKMFFCKTGLPEFRSPSRTPVIGF